MFLLVLSLLTLAAGPALLTVIHPESRGRAALDAFVVVGIAGLVLLHVVPEAVEIAGWPAATATALGVAFPLLLHRIYPNGFRAADTGAAVGGLVALLTHSMLDGVSLATSGPRPALALAVVLHRLPLGLAVWWLGQTVIGRRAALAILFTEGAGTLLGYGLGDVLEAVLNAKALPVFQAFMAGTVLHVVVGHGPHTEGTEDGADPTHAGHGGHGGVRGFRPGRRGAGVLGALLAVAFLLALHLAE